MIKSLYNLLLSLKAHPPVATCFITHLPQTTPQTIAVKKGGNIF